MPALSNSLIIIGFKAAGKTTLGKNLAHVLTLPCCDLDELILKKMGYLDIQTLSRELGFVEFRHHELLMVKELSLIPQPMIISTGGGVVLNDELMRCLQEMGKIVFLHTAFEHIEERLFHDKNEILYLNQSINRAALRAIYQNRLPRYMAYADIVIGGD